MPGVCASRSHAFVSGHGNTGGYLLNVTTRGENAPLPSPITGTACAKALDGSQLVLLSAASQDDLEDLMFQDVGGMGETRSVYGRTWAWMKGNVSGGAAWVDITDDVALRGGAARLKQIVLNHESVSGMRDVEARRAVNQVLKKYQ